MKRNILLALGMSMAVFAGGCSGFIPQADLLSTQEETQAVSEISTDPTTEQTSASEDSTAEDNIETETGETGAVEGTDDSDEADVTEASAEERFSTDEAGNLIIDIGGSTETTPVSSSGRMEEYTNTYTSGNISIDYPVIIGMSDEEMQEWANKELYEDAMSIIDLYEVDPEVDTLTVTYEVSVIYRSEFSLVYTGTLEQGSGSHNTISIRLADDLDLSLQKHIRLEDRLSAAKLTSSILETGDYTILSTNFDEETLKNYLASQSEDFYTSLIKTADFGGADAPVGFSYNSMGNVAVIIPVPHMFGDYAEISIAQQTK
jgi:hypothetical protein